MGIELADLLGDGGWITGLLAERGPVGGMVGGIW